MIADKIIVIKMFPLKINKQLKIKMTSIVCFHLIYIYNPLVNSPIIRGLLVNAITGSVANGSCKLITAFNRSFIPVKSLILLKNAT